MELENLAGNKRLIKNVFSLHHLLTQNKSLKIVYIFLKVICLSNLTLIRNFHR